MRDSPSPLSARQTAVLLIAHGSRQQEANDDLYYFAEQLRQRGRYGWVEAAFLELAEPTIEVGAVRCVEQGASQVILLPYFLSAGVHVRRDLTEARDRLQARFPHVRFRLAEPLGRHPLLLEVITERVRDTEIHGTR